MAIRISKILKESNIALDLKNQKRCPAIHEVIEQLATNESMVNLQGFHDEVLARERIESTCLGNGVAFPHARTDHVKGMVIAVGRSLEGVEFETVNQSVRLIFVIGTPKKMVTDYLSVVGSLARLLKDEGLRQRLLRAETASEFLEALAEAEGKLA
jgi:mannitol/fructose-specific phosphotransferase system IIA component (Ntr-type)